MNKQDFKRSCMMESRLHFAQMECQALLRLNDPGNVAAKYASIDCDLAQCILDLREARERIQNIGWAVPLSWHIMCEAIAELDDWIAWVKACRDELHDIAIARIVRCCRQEL